MGIKPGARAALDIGKVRIGLAYATAGSRLALPLETVAVAEDGSDLAAVALQLEKYQVSVTYVGLPLLLSGKEGEAARMARAYARRLARCLCAMQVRLLDERLTSSSAHARLTAAGVRGRRHREMVDQVAASVILEQALSMEQDEMPGELVIG